MIRKQSEKRSLWDIIQRPWCSADRFKTRKKPTVFAYFSFVSCVELPKFNISSVRVKLLVAVNKKHNLTFGTISK